MLRPTDDIVCSTTLDQLISSDHYCISRDLFAPNPVNNTEHKHEKKIGTHFITDNADIIKLTILQYVHFFKCLLTA